MPRDRNKTFLTEGVHYKSKTLSCCQILNLVSEYPYTKTEDLVNKYGISYSICNTIATYYGVKKDENFLKEMRRGILVVRNKEMGRDLTKDFILEQGLKYSSKKEWYHKDPSTYATANRLGVMEEATRHMVNFSFSVPQIILKQLTEYIFNEKCLYNDRKTIKPYELDVYFNDLGIAFEYDGRLWHKEDVVDKFNLCENKEILLITIVERNRNYLSDIKEQILEHLDLINDFCELNIKEEDILSFNEPIEFPKLFTDEELFLLRNNTKTFLRKNYNNLYEKYKKYNPDNLVFTCRKYTEEDAKEAIKKYGDVKSIYKHDKNLYQAIHKRFKHLIITPTERRIICTTNSIIFDSVKHVCEKYNIERKYLFRVLSGERKKVKNMEFEYYD